MSSPLFGNLTGRAPGSNPSIMVGRVDVLGLPLVLCACSGAQQCTPCTRPMLQVSWEVVPCAGLKPGTIKLLKKEGGR